LVLPISKSLVTGARFLTGKTVYRYMPFHFVITILSLLEKQEYPLYLFGGKNQILKKAEKNIHRTFPLLKIVGRCEGRLRKQDEPSVIEAIRRTSPSLLLAGKGIRGKELWMARNSKRLNAGLRLWCSDLFEVFAEKKRRPSDAVFEKGLENVGYCLKNPLRFFRIFSYFRYKLLLLFYKLFKK
jgi:N-acetylglucosaminyldiphosphoundecaprenol N-acetyl-beta-D-mannosaminyltransferase